MYRGQAQLGEEIYVGVPCRNASRSPALPDESPTMRVYDHTGTLVVSRQIPVQDRYGTTGLFADRLFLGSLFNVGRYFVLYTWTTDSGAFSGAELDLFDILTGGDADGQFLSLFFVETAQADFLVGQTNGGILTHNRNPRI